jgi:hypothetical protein
MTDQDQRPRRASTRELGIAAAVCGASAGATLLLTIIVFRLRSGSLEVQLGANAPLLARLLWRYPMGFGILTLVGSGVAVLAPLRMRDPRSGIILSAALIVFMLVLTAAIIATIPLMLIELQRLVAVLA